MARRVVPASIWSGAAGHSDLAISFPSTALEVSSRRSPGRGRDACDEEESIFVGGRRGEIRGQLGSEPGDVLGVRRGHCFSSVVVAVPAGRPGLGSCRRAGARAIAIRDAAGAQAPGTSGASAPPPRGVSSPGLRRPRRQCPCSANLMHAAQADLDGIRLVGRAVSCAVQSI